MFDTIKRIISVLLVVILCMSGTIGAASAKNIYDEDVQLFFGLDVNEDILSEIDQYIVDETQMHPYAVLPSAVDNTSLFPSPGNQGNQDSCVAWALGYALKSQQEASKRGWTVNNDIHNFSPAYIFNKMKNGAAGGLDIIDALNFMYDYGVCPLSYFEYDSNDWATQPDEIADAAAALYKIYDYNGVMGTTSIKTCLANGEGVVIGIGVYSDFVNLNNENPIYDVISGNYIAGHAICLIGYDDNMGDSGAFKFINSWGTNKQINGYGWISYDLVNNELINQYGPGVGFVIHVNEYDDYCMGDVDGNNVITAADSRLALRISAKIEEYTSEQYVLADVDGDSIVTAADSRYILQYSSQAIDKFPLYE